MYSQPQHVNQNSTEPRLKELPHIPRLQERKEPKHQTPRTNVDFYRQKLSSTIYLLLERNLHIINLKLTLQSGVLVRSYEQQHDALVDIYELVLEPEQDLVDELLAQCRLVAVTEVLVDTFLELLDTLADILAFGMVLQHFLEGDFVVRTSARDVFRRRAGCYEHFNVLDEVLHEISEASIAGEQGLYQKLCQRPTNDGPNVQAHMLTVLFVGFLVETL